MWLMLCSRRDSSRRPWESFPSAETPQDHWNPLEHWHILYKMDKGRALGTTGFFFPRIFTSPGTEFPHPAVNHKGSDLLLGNGFKKPPLPPAMQEINRFTGGEWDTLFRAFHKFLKLESCYFLIGLRPGKENMVSEQEAEGKGLRWAIVQLLGDTPGVPRLWRVLLNPPCRSSRSSGYKIKYYRIKYNIEIK